MANKLEAVLLVTTSKEIDNGMFFKFVSQFKDMPPTNMTLVININNYTHSVDIEPYLNVYTGIFDYVEVNYLNIPKEQDVYTRKPIEVKKLPELGSCSGPNILFLESIRYCRKFDSILLLETDCIIKKDSFTIAANYVKNLGDYLISGARYDGQFASGHDNIAFFNHVNGVAFYKTCSGELQGLIDKVEQHIIDNVKTRTQFFPYDLAIMSYFFTNNRLADHNTKIMYRKILTTTLIINLSPNSDWFYSMEYVNGHYPNHIILHKKDHA